MDCGQGIPRGGKCYFQRKPKMKTSALLEYPEGVAKACTRLVNVDQQR